MNSFKVNWATALSLCITAFILPAIMVLSMDDMTSPNTGKPVASYGIFNDKGEEIARPDIYFFYDVQDAKEKPDFKFKSMELEHEYLAWRLGDLT